MLPDGTFQPATVQSRLQAALGYDPSAGEYLGAHVDQAYDRTTTARVAEELGIMRAEQEEGTWDAAYAQGQATQEFTGPFAGMTPPAHRFAMTEEEWKNSDLYVPTAKFRPDLTVTRARIMKENYDQRRYLESLVSRGDESYGLGMKALGFGASLVGSLPDPVNFIPFAGGFKAANVGRGMAKGALEGAAGNALADALVLPDLAAKGEDVGFADALLDTAFGALLGGALGGLGGALGGYAGKRFEARTGDGLLPRNEAADLLRASLGAGDRAVVTRAMEKALADFHADRPVDVSEVLRESEVLGRAYDMVRRDPLGGPADEVLATLHPDDIEAVLVHRGPAIEVDGKIKVQGNALKKATGSKSGYGLVKIIFAHGEGGGKLPDMPPVSRGDVINLPQILREWEPIDESGHFIWRVPREDGHNLNIIARKGTDNPDSWLVSMYVGKGDEAPSKRKPPSESSPSVSAQGRDTSQWINTFASGGQNGVYNKKIRSSNSDVNASLERPHAFTSSPRRKGEGRGGL